MERCYMCYMTSLCLSLRILRLGLKAWVGILLLGAFWAWGTLAYGQVPAVPGMPPGNEIAPTIPVIPGLPGSAPTKPEDKPIPPVVPSYLELSTDDSLAKQSGNIQRMLRDGNFTAVANGQQVFQDYYEKYFFPSWTKAANRSKLQQLRSQLIVSDLGNAARNGGPPRDLLVQTAFNVLSGYVQNDQLDPAVRVAALLSIGDLNAQERPTGGGMQPPTPYPPALSFLINISKDPNQSDALRLAALIGLERHCGCGISDGNVRDTQVIPLLLQIATEKDTPANKDPKIHEWFRVRAIDILALLSQPGANAQNVQTLLNMVADQNESSRVRLAAAKALGSFDYSKVQGIDLMTIPQGLGKMVLELCIADIQVVSQSGAIDKLEPKKVAQYVGAAQQGLRSVRQFYAGKPEDQSIAKLNRALDEITKTLTDSAEAYNPSMELARLLPTALTSLSTALQGLPAGGAASPASDQPQPAAASAGT